MKATIAIFAITITSLIFGCSKKDHQNESACDKPVLLNKNLYDNTFTNNYMITDANINGDCLEIKFGASGCDSKTWVVELVDAEMIAKSALPQRSIKLALTNNEFCAAAFTKTVSFNLQPLRVSGSQKISLTLAGFNNPIIYSY